MTEDNKQNSAGRLWAIFNSLRHYGNGGAGMDAWGHVLGVDGTALPSKERRLTAQLQTVVHQIDLTREGLLNMGVPERLYEPTLQVFAEAASPALLRTTWNNSSLREEHLLCLGWAQYCLPCEGEVIEAATIEDLRATLQELKDQVAPAGFPLPLRGY